MRSRCSRCCSAKVGFVDFIRDALDGHSDADIGAAVRDVHRGCRKVLDQHLTFEPVMPGAEEARVAVPKGFDPAEIRLIGEAKGEPPYRGTLRHHGWRVTDTKLPALADGVDRRGDRRPPKWRSRRERAAGPSKRILGIDLAGTTNSAVAVASDDEAARAVPVAQVVAAGEIAARPTLPSFLLLPSEHEVAPARKLQLPWSGPLKYAVGAFARDRGAELPHRLVASAKSWLCNPSIDRTAQVLPFRGAQRELDAEMAGGERVSPVNASARYLAHLRAVWDDANPDEPADEQEVLVTVPASFDAVARELTVVAAREAGFDRVTLLEEPQAAFYAYLAAARRYAWRKDLGRAGEDRAGV